MGIGVSISGVLDLSDISMSSFQGFWSYAQEIELADHISFVKVLFSFSELFLECSHPD